MFSEKLPDGEEYGAGYFMETAYLIAQKGESGITWLRQKLASPTKSAMITVRRPMLFAACGYLMIHQYTSKTAKNPGQAFPFPQTASDVETPLHLHEHTEMQNEIPVTTIAYFCRLAASLIFLLPGILIISFNYLYLLIRLKKGKNPSTIPLLGSLCLSFGLLLFPAAGVQIFCWIPFLLDPGNWEFGACYFKRKKQN